MGLKAPRKKLFFFSVLSVSPCSRREILETYCRSRDMGLTGAGILLAPFAHIATWATNFRRLNHAQLVKILYKNSCGEQVRSRPGGNQGGLLMVESQESGIENSPLNPISFILIRHTARRCPGMMKSLLGGQTFLSIRSSQEDRQECLSPSFFQDRSHLPSSSSASIGVHRRLIFQTARLTRWSKTPPHPGADRR